MTSHPRFLRSLMAPVLAAALFFPCAALAQEPPDEPDEPEQPMMTHGVEHAIEVITRNMDRQLEHLTALLDQAPDSAKPGIERAIQANTEGRSKALEVLGGQLPPGDGEELGAMNEEPGEMDTSGNESGDSNGDVTTESLDTSHARATDRKKDAQAAITEAGDRSARELKAVIGQVDRDLRREMARTLRDIRRDNRDSLRAIDQMGRPERPSRPEVAGVRPDRPQRPERPEAIRPERPERPEHPGRP